MYDQFYKFLAHVIVNFFENTELRPGAKYDIRLPNQEEVEGLYTVLTQVECAEPFIYQAEGQGVYETYSLSVGGLKVILASTAMNVTDAFLTALRNKVGVEEALFRNTAILFIHDSALDSILNGSESLQKIGMPLHTSSIKKVVEAQLKEEDYSLTVRRILQFVMNNKEGKQVDVRNGLVEYREVLEVLNQGRIDSRQYNEFGLFYDSELENLSDSEVKERLKENAKYYGIIFNYRQFNIKDNILEKSFTKKNMESIDSKYWNTLDYEQLYKWMQKNKSKHPIEYLSSEKKLTEEGLTYWEAPEKDTAAGRRTLNIIIFNPDQLSEINLILKFDQSLSAKNCQIAKGSKVEIQTSGKKMKLTLEPSTDGTTYSRIKYKDVKDYNFKILVVPIEEDLLKALKSCYKLPTKIADQGIYIEPIEEFIRINTTKEEVQQIELKEQGEVVEISLDKAFMISNGVNDEECDVTGFTLKYKDRQIPMFIKGETIKPKVITAVKLAKLRRENEQNFTYWYNKEEDTLKLYQDTAQYYVVDELLDRLKMEIQMIQSDGNFFNVFKENELEVQSLEIPETIREAYSRLITYYRTNATLPSLATITDELEVCMRDYVSAYTEAVEEIEKGTILKQSQKNLLRLATIINKKKQEILWTPLHPINMVYELQRQSQLRRDEVDEQVLKKLKPLGLVPYIRDEEGVLYESKEINELTWLKFAPHHSSNVQGKYEHAKIVEKSIQFFTSHFAYLFEGSLRQPLKINLIGTGEAEVLLGGLLRVIGSGLKKQTAEELMPIEFRVYTNERSKNIFHELEYDTFNMGQFLENFDISYDEENHSLDEFTRIFRSKVSIYKVEDQQRDYNECHICFVSVQGEEEISYRDSYEVLSTTYLGGMINASTVYLEDNSYVKTVGLKGLEDHLFKRTIGAVNALAYVGMSSAPFAPHTAIATVIDQDEVTLSPEVHQAATWTVYLEPRVDYSYFSQIENTLIHYIDRLYAPSTIDAITLSHKIGSYKRAIQNKVELLGLGQEIEELETVIKLCNILNGEWLIELLSTKKSNTLESIHNPLLIRWSTQNLNKENFIWVPVSLHEFMRTCENIGIRSSKGLFKSKNYERLINDIIWIGYQVETVSICFYPISLRKNEKEAGIFKEFSENIYDQSFEGRYFRQLLVERGLSNLQELLKAGLFEDHRVDDLLDETMRGQLLQGNFKVIQANPEKLGYESKIVFWDKDTVEMTRSKTALTIFMNQKLLWKNELCINGEVIEVQGLTEDFVESIPDEIQNIPPEEGIDREGVQESVEEVPEEKPVNLEDLFYVPRYSIVYYFEVLPENIKEIMDLYIQRGIKLYLIMNESCEEFKNRLGHTLEAYEELVRKQVLSITYNVQIHLEDEGEVYIADGEVRHDAFYEQLKATDFNIEQYEIEHAPIGANLSVKAGAGTGKTKVMIDRIMFLKHMDATILLSEMAMITFTNESMIEMRSRLSNRLTTYYQMTRNRKYLTWMDELNTMKISTIHSFAMDILQSIGNEIGVVDLQITSYNHLKDRLIEEAIDGYSKAYNSEYQAIKMIPQYDIKRIIKRLSSFLDNRAVKIEAEWENIDFGECMMGYEKLFKYVLKYVDDALQKEKIDSSKYEINDLIKMLKDITEVQSIGNRIKLKYIMVDEFQDTDEVQVEFVAWLVERLNAVLFIVGDIKQSIYRFRGADYTAFKQIEDLVSGKMVPKYITKNYRTTKKLVEDLNKLFIKISYDVDTFEFDDHSYLQATKESTNDQGIEVIRVSDDESKYVKIRDIYHEHIDEGSICILTRTNSQVNQIVRILEEMNVPSVAEVKGDFYRQPAVRDFYLLVRALIYTERFEEWILLEQSVYGTQTVRDLEVINKYESDTSHARLILQDTEWYKELIQKARRAQDGLPLKVIREIIEKQKPYLKYARSYYNHLRSEEMNKEKLIEVARYKGIEYEVNLNHLLYLLQKEFTDQTMTLASIEAYLKVKIATDIVEDRVSLEADESLQAVRVMTVHKAKGLEFNTVIIPFTNENKISNYYRDQFILGEDGNKYKLGFKIHPKRNQEESHNNHYSALMRDEHNEIVGEETRLLYVACTRAKNRLCTFVEQIEAKSSRINSWQDLLIKR